MTLGEKQQVMTCDACGAELEVGDWPFCHGDVAAHTPAKRFNLDPLEPYVDQQLTTDPNGVEITTRGQRMKLMEREGLVYHSNKYVNNGRVYLDMGKGR